MSPSMPHDGKFMGQSHTGLLQKAPPLRVKEDNGRAVPAGQWIWAALRVMENPGSLESYLWLLVPQVPWRRRRWTAFRVSIQQSH